MTSAKKQTIESFDSAGTCIFGDDYSFEQSQFLRNIERVAPEVIKDLKRSVLPLFIRKQKDLASRGIDASQFPPAANENDPNSTAPTPGPKPRPEELDIPGYDPDTWCAIWEWAHRYFLVEADAVPVLKTRKAVAVARHMDRNYMARTYDSCRMRGFLDYHVKVDSPSLTFALPFLIRVVLLTLNTWASAGKRSKLTWYFPDLDPTAFDYYDLEHFRGVIDSQRTMLELLEVENIEFGGPDNFPFIYEFSPVLAWNLRRETRAQAESRILKNLTLK